MIFCQGLNEVVESHFKAGTNCVAALITSLLQSVVGILVSSVILLYRILFHFYNLFPMIHT